MAEYKNLLFVGMSFIVASLIQLTVYYYQNTIQPVVWYFPILVFVCIGTALFIMVLFTGNYFKNWRMTLVLLIFVLTAISAIYIPLSQTPKAYISYSFKCNDNLQSIDLTFQNSGTIYGTAIIDIKPSSENVTILDLRSPMIFPPITVQRNSLTMNYKIDYSKYYGEELTFSMNLRCDDTSNCQTYMFSDNQVSCRYSENKNTPYQDYIRNETKLSEQLSVVATMPVVAAPTSSIIIITIILVIVVFFIFIKYTSKDK